jgi:g-D-glutamyl-meso-diaminopimelate peptidase
MTAQLLMKQLEHYLALYGSVGADGERFADRMRDVAFYLVPMTNPDGIAISQQGIDAIRSEELRQCILAAYDNDMRRGGYDQHYDTREDYLVKWKANAKGVDLNRNFGIDGWDSVKTGVTYPSSQKYKGETPNSEPETKALMELTQSLDGLLCTVSLHAQGEILYWDCGQSGDIRDRTLQLVGAIQAVNGYRAQSEFTQADASYNDWCVLKLGVPSVNVEIGVGACPLPIEQFFGVYEQNLTLWEALLNLYRT